MSRLHDALNPTKSTVISPYQQPARRAATVLPNSAPTAGWQRPAAAPLQRIESPIGLPTVLLGLYTLLYMAPVVEIMAYYLHLFLPIIIVVGSIMIVVFPF